jgi:hypothetical protein
MSCQYGSSVVGTWTLFVDWACLDAPNHGSMTFDIDGTWSAPQGDGGNWLQIEGMVVWNHSETPELIYAANVTNNALNGIHGYVQAQEFPSPDRQGSFYAVRVRP